MTVDYAEPLKIVWERIRCTKPCHVYQKVGNSEKYCKGHAALLEMVDSHVSELTYLDHSGRERKRRRIRAAVGVDDA